MLSWIAWLLFSCTDPGPIDGNWVFKNSDGHLAGALLASRDKAQIAIWGPSFGTDGLVDGVIGIEDDIPWVFFPVQTGLGDADAAMRLQGREAMLPLGSRRGEHEVRYTAIFDQSLTEAERAKVDHASKNQISNSVDAWKEGAFLLKTGNEIVGQIQFLGSEPPVVALFDQYWLTPEPVVADKVVVGADIRLEFPIEPSFRNELGFLIVNVPTLTAVAPVGPQPDPLDRRFDLIPGRLTEAERKQKANAAIGKANSRENQQVLLQAERLSAASRKNDNCVQLMQLPKSRRLEWEGYAVTILHRNGICEVQLQPDPPQHRRRFSGMAFPSETR